MTTLADGKDIATRAAVALTAVFLLGGRAMAFHSGGVAECGGCQSMHSAVSPDGNLLIAADSTSTCLSCHMHVGDTQPASYHIAGAGARPRVGWKWGAGE